MFSDLSQVTQKFKGILLDAYGVFWGGNSVGLFPAAKEAMRGLVSNGKIVGILSNSTQLVSREIEKFKKHGLERGAHFHFMVTSGEIAKKVFLHSLLPFATPKKTYILLGKVHPRFMSHLAIFEGSEFKEVSNVEEADFFYISIPHIDGEDQIDLNVFKKDLPALVSFGLPIVCPNPDQFAHEGNPPRAVVRQGSIAKMCEELGGTVFYIGKPSSIAYEASIKQFADYGLTEVSKILMIGDTPETDIRGAHHVGMPAALITETGIMSERMIKQGFENAIQALPKSDFPDFFIRSFTL